MKTNEPPNNCSEKVVNYNAFMLDTFIKNNNIILEKNLIDISQMIKKIIKIEYGNNFIEVYSQNNKKKQYLKLYRDGDYTFFSDIF